MMVGGAVAGDVLTTETAGSHSLHNLLVVPGQVIATSNNDIDGGGGQDGGGSGSFLRGHGTYVETVAVDDGRTQQKRLIASVVGTVQRVNKLVLVQSSSSSTYTGHVGDLVVGRIIQVGNQRWTVELTSTSRPASLPLSGVHLPGGIQRVRTQQDAREMRQYLMEGSLVSAEVHKIMQGDGGLSLHTRSIKYGKLENGIAVVVPPSLIPRLAQHNVRLINQFDMLLGCNGQVWIQRKMADTANTRAAEGGVGEGGTGSAAAAAEEGGSSSIITSPSKLGHQELAEFHEKNQQVHRETPYSVNDRHALSRMRNTVLCLSKVWLLITPQHIQYVYNQSIQLKYEPYQILQPDIILKLTEELRSRQ